MTLFVVGTPIGNLEDVTARAGRVLSEADVVACEDTRRTAGLLAHLGVKKPLLRYDEHVHGRETPRILQRLKAGEKVALVSDAGVPGVSDPGARLVREAVDAGVEVVPIPGPSAVLTALSASGFQADRFVFLGFPPRRPGRMKRMFASVPEGFTAVFFESGFRVAAALDAAAAVWGGSRAMVAREITKLHEELLRGTLPELAAILRARPHVKGEVTVVVESPVEPEPDPEKDNP